MEHGTWGLKHGTWYGHSLFLVLSLSRIAGVLREEKVGLCLSLFFFSFFYRYFLLLRHENRSFVLGRIYENPFQSIPCHII